jgi:putative addiction module killer protein
MAAARPRTLLIYQDAAGDEPFTKWLGGIRDPRTRIRIERRVERMRLGNFGDRKGVGEGVQEMRLDVGPGYRIYFAEDGETVVLLLCGGDKSTQARDIARAKRYWHDYLEDRS